VPFAVRCSIEGLVNLKEALAGLFVPKLAMDSHAGKKNPA